MAANGGGPPFVKKEDQDFDPMLLRDDNNNYSNNRLAEKNNNHKGISIAERRAAKCGFNASGINVARFRTPGLSPPALSPYFTVPPGLSPSALLDSPIMLPNAQAQLSPTTGTFQFPPSPNHESLKLKLKVASNVDSTIAMESSPSKAEALGVPLSEPSSFIAGNKPFEECGYPKDLQEMTKTGVLGGSKPNSREVESLSMQPNSSRNQMMLNIDQRGRERINTHPKNGSKPNSREVESLRMQPSSSRNQMMLNIDQRGRERINTHPKSGCPKEVTKCAEDGFYWRKYGQKQVKGGEHPRSYYKCTYPNCQVTKKVERSHDGQISEIVYKGTHDHPTPQPFKRLNEMPEMCGEGNPSCFRTEGTRKDAAGFGSERRGHDALNGGESSSSFLGQDFPVIQPVENQEFPPAFRTQEASPESISTEEDDECEPKKRKRDGFPTETTPATRSTREPKVVVQIESDIDILDDGYRWRKYGQKVVKGNPNPRSYYKCTTPGCQVRKHVERAADDIKSVITTYEGKHSHEVPSSKTNSLVMSDVANLPPPLTNTSTPKPDVLNSVKQVQDMPFYLDRKPILNYNELMSSNMPGNISSDLNFGPSPVYPLSFPPFHSLTYDSLLMNSNPMKNYPLSQLYPMIPDYMPLPLQINNVPGSSNAPLAGNFHYNNYAAMQPSSGGQDMRDSHARMVTPKEEQRDEDELYETCLSLPNHGNETM